MKNSQQRTEKDRRKTPTPFFGRNTLRGRRMQARRGDENSNYYVDRYEYKYLFLILGLVLLSILDAYFTLNILQGGGIELNPLMEFLISRNSKLFLGVKVFLTAFCILFFLIHKNFYIFGRLRMSAILNTVFLLYITLIIYEIYLIITYL